jgi:transposase family protein
VFADQRHAAFKVTWNVYQKVIDAYQTEPTHQGEEDHDPADHQPPQQHPDWSTKATFAGTDDDTPPRRHPGILFDHPGTSNGPTEAINGFLERLRGTARGFRSLTNYITRSLLDTSGFRPPIHSLL